MPRLILLSADALMSEDIPYLATLPNYKKYLGGCAQVFPVHSIYPTLTYPCHATLITGQYPESHGVVNNSRLAPGHAPTPWVWERDYGRCPLDLFTQARRAGLRTASVFWPTTGHHPAVDYLIPEYWPQEKGETLEQAMASMGSTPEVVSVLREMRKGRNPAQHPEADDFAIDCACELLRRFQPEVLAVHPVNIDEARHRYGVHNDKVEEAIRQIDGYIGQICRVLEALELLQETAFVLTSDHGQRTIRQQVRLNALLRQAGFITCSETGALLSWDVWALSGGMSGLLFMRDPQDREMHARLDAWLSALPMHQYGISACMNEQSSRLRDHLGGPFSYVLEAADGTSFSDSILFPVVSSLPSEPGYSRATHGYHPSKGPHPVFLAKGPGIREDIRLSSARLVDIAPTLAAILGCSLPRTAGSILPIFSEKG